MAENVADYNLGFHTFRTSIELNVPKALQLSPVELWLVGVWRGQEILSFLGQMNEPGVLDRVSESHTACLQGGLNFVSWTLIALLRDVADDALL